MRVDYEEHLAECLHCRMRQRRHRTIDVLLLCAFSLTFVAFLLVALVIHRVEMLTHIDKVHVALHSAAAVSRIPASITISLEAVAISGLVVSMLLCILVAIATPIPSIVTGFVRQRVSPEMRDRLSKHAA
jgi:ABC-type sulfate transport system permease component